MKQVFMKAIWEEIESQRLLQPPNVEFIKGLETALSIVETMTKTSWKRDSKLPRIDILLELYQTKEPGEIARIYKVTPRAITGKLRSGGYIPKEIRKQKFESRKQEVISLAQEGKTTREIAKITGFSKGYCQEILKEKGIPYFRLRSNYSYPLKPVGCDDCIKNPYSKGLCRNCYIRQLRRSKEIK